jgi:23S rRNA pseudouridine2457 synthase
MSFRAGQNRSQGSGLIQLPPTRVILLNKPYDVLSQFTQDHPGQRTLAEFDLPKDIYAAGRLDRDSEGLLLLTNDGQLIKRLLDPEHGHQRTYLVQVEGDITSEALHRLSSGIKIGGYTTKPARAEKMEAPDVPERIPPIRVRKNIPTSWIRLTLIEGKNRQVRRMTAAVGYPTLRLIRESMGELTLEGLLPGEFRELSGEEIKKLKLGHK